MDRLRRNGMGSDDGAAAVEFALILPMLILMVLAIVDMGKMVSTRSALESAARAAVQASFADPTDDATMMAAASAALSTAGITGGSVQTPVHLCECSSGATVDCTTGTCPSGSVRHTVTVTVTKDYSPIYNLTNLPFGLGIDFTMTLPGTATMRAK